MTWEPTATTFNIARGLVIDWFSRDLSHVPHSSSVIGRLRHYYLQPLSLHRAGQFSRHPSPSCCLIFQEIFVISYHPRLIPPADHEFAPQRWKNYLAGTVVAAYPQTGRLSLATSAPVDEMRDVLVPHSV